MNETSFTNNYGFDVNCFLLSSLTKENRKYCENTAFQTFPYSDASKVMMEITEAFYSGFYERTTPQKSREFKEKYGRLSSFQDAYLFYFLNEYYCTMNDHLKRKTVGDDLHRYKFLATDIAKKLKEEYQKRLGISPFSFVSRKFPKERHLIGHFSKLNGVEITNIHNTFTTHLATIENQKKSSMELNEQRKNQIRWLKDFLDKKDNHYTYSLISNGIWEGFYDHSFHEIKELFAQHNISVSRLSKDLDFNLLSYRVAMMDTMISILQTNNIFISDLFVVFSREIGRLAKAHFTQKQNVYPYTYVQNYYLKTDQISLFDDKNSIKTNRRRS